MVPCLYEERHHGHRVLIATWLLVSPQWAALLAPRCTSYVALLGAYLWVFYGSVFSTGSKCPITLSVALHVHRKILTRNASLLQNALIPLFIGGFLQIHCSTGVVPVQCYPLCSFPPFPPHQPYTHLVPHQEPVPVEDATISSI